MVYDIFKKYLTKAYRILWRKLANNRDDIVYQLVWKWYSSKSLFCTMQNFLFQIITEASDLSNI